MNCQRLTCVVCFLSHNKKELFFTVCTDLPLKTRVTSYHDVLDTAGCLECRRVSWSQAAGGLGKVLCSGKQVSDLVG